MDVVLRGLVTLYEIVKETICTVYFKVGWKRKTARWAWTVYLLNVCHRLTPVLSTTRRYFVLVLLHVVQRALELLLPCPFAVPAHEPRQAARHGKPKKAMVERARQEFSPPPPNRTVLNDSLQAALLVRRQHDPTGCAPQHGLQKARVPVHLVFIAGRRHGRTRDECLSDGTDATEC